MYSKYYNINTIILQLHYGIVPKMAAALPRWMINIFSINCYFTSSAGFNQPEHIRNYPTILVPLITGQIEQVYPFALHRTHGKLFYDPRSFNYSVVLAEQLGLIPLNSLNILLLSFKQFGCVELLELMKCSPMILVPSITQ